MKKVLQRKIKEQGNMSTKERNMSTKIFSNDNTTFKRKKLKLKSNDKDFIQSINYSNLVVPSNVFRDFTKIHENTNSKSVLDSIIYLRDQGKWLKVNDYTYKFKIKDFYCIIDKNYKVKKYFSKSSETILQIMNRNNALDGNSLSYIKPIDISSKLSDTYIDSLGIDKLDLDKVKIFLNTDENDSENYLKDLIAEEMEIIENKFNPNSKVNGNEDKLFHLTKNLSLKFSDLLVYNNGEIIFEVNISLKKIGNISII